jgi:hypothetical protein
MITRIVPILITLLCAAVANLQSVHAATGTVKNTNDSGAFSLRFALAHAKDGDTIDFDASVTGTILLTSGQLVVDKSVTINGPGANVLAVDGNHASSVFYISPGKTVTISGLTITNGNGATNGGGIHNDGGTLTVDNCTVSSSSAFDSGGGINNYGGTLTVDNCTVSSSSAYFGGGICNDSRGGSATLTVTNSTLNGNSAGEGGGGAIFNGGAQGAANMTMNNCTVSSNLGNRGAGIFTYFGTVTVTNSTFSGNSGMLAGAIYTQGVVTLGDTIFNAGALGANIVIGSNPPGTVTSLGYNLSSDAGGGQLTAMGDQISTNPMLDPMGLQDNGGSTLTIALQALSPAIDMGDPSFTPPPDYDQRGNPFVRVSNGRIDIGAFELQPTPTPTPTPAPTATPRPRPTPPPHPTPPH